MTHVKLIITLSVRTKYRLNDFGKIIVTVAVEYALDY